MEKKNSITKKHKEKENIKFTPFLVKFTPFLRTSDYMRIKFECVYPIPPDVHLT